MSAEQDAFLSKTIDMLDAVKKMVIEKKLRAFAIIVCEQDKGVRTDFQMIDRAPQMALLGAVTLLSHDLTCQIEHDARTSMLETTIEEVIEVLSTPPKSSMN